MLTLLKVTCYLNREGDNNLNDDSTEKVDNGDNENVNITESSDIATVVSVIELIQYTHFIQCRQIAV